MKSNIAFRSSVIALIIATTSGVASAAAGDISAFDSSGGVYSTTVGNKKAGAIYMDVTTSDYFQFPGGSGAPVKISLSATSSRSLTGILHDKTVPVVGLFASADGDRQGSHMQGSAESSIRVGGNVVWEDADDYDVNAWAGSEASNSRSEQIFSHSKSYTATIPVGPATVNLKGTLGGSVSVSVAATSDFWSNNGRHGRVSGITTGTARADLHAEASFGVPYVASLGVYADINVMTIALPGVAVAGWEWASSEPVDSRNQYSCVAVNNVTGETGGGTFGAKLLGPLNVEIANKKLATWGGRRLFDDVIRSESHADVARDQ